MIAQQALTGRGEGIRIDKSTDLGIVVSALEVVVAGFGWALLRTRRGCPPPGRYFSASTCRKIERNCYVPASIAFWGQKAVCWDNPKPL